MCARELATNSVLSRPAVRARFEELLLALRRVVRPPPSRTWPVGSAGMLDRRGSPTRPSGAGMDLESLQGMFGDPEALLGDLLTPESRRTSDQLTSLAVVVDAYADHIADGGRGRSWSAPTPSWPRPGTAAAPSGARARRRPARCSGSTSTRPRWTGGGPSSPA